MNTKYHLSVALALCAFVGPSHTALAVTPTLVWSDEFNGAVGSGPDPTKWTYDLGGGGWGNNELETYTDSRNNSLIVADPLATDGFALAIRAQNSNGSYTSARIKTQGLFAWQYGRMEARARIPSGAGYWPAFWTLGNNIATAGWPACGEVDIMEWVPQTPSEIYGSLHSVGSNNLTEGYILPNGAAYADGYHVFAIDWYPNEIVFSMDGIVYEDQKESALPASTAWPFTQPFFIILNLAVGGDWPGSPNSSTVFPADYRVDYVRVYSLPATPRPTWSGRRLPLQTSSPSPRPPHRSACPGSLRRARSGQLSPATASSARATRPLRKTSRPSTQAPRPRTWTGPRSQGRRIITG